MTRLAVRVAAASRRWPPAYRALRAGHRAVGERLPPRPVPGVPGRVHRNDLMLTGRSAAEVEAYVSLGARAVDLLADAVAPARLEDLRDLVDLGCGHGRVLRHLVRRVDPARVTAVDLDASAAAFCAAEFGVRTADAAAGLPPADLVWCGSVLTHLDRPVWEALVADAGRALRPGGTLVFSAHGPQALEGLGRELPYVAEALPALRRELAATGAAYLAYPHYSGAQYGLTVHTRPAVEAAAARAGLLLHRHRERTWAAHDVYALRRPG